jgi:phage tail protein X
VKEDGFTVDLICWMHYGRTEKATEAVFEANPGLAHCGLTLLLGLIIDLPEIKEEPVKPVVRLYD